MSRLKFKTTRSLGQSPHKAVARIRALGTHADVLEWTTATLHAAQEAPLAVVRHAMGEDAAQGWGRLCSWGMPDAGHIVGADLLAELERLFGFRPSATVQSLYDAHGPPTRLGYGAFDGGDWCLGERSAALVFGFASAAPEATLSAFLGTLVEPCVPVRLPELTGVFRFAARFSGGGKVKGRLTIVGASCSVDVEVSHPNQPGGDLAMFHNKVVRCLGNLNAGKAKRIWVGTGDRIPTLKLPGGPKSGKKQTKRLTYYGFRALGNDSRQTALASLRRFAAAFGDGLAWDDAMFISEEPIGATDVESVVATTFRDDSTFDLAAVPLVAVQDPETWCRECSHELSEPMKRRWARLGTPAEVAWRATRKNGTEQPSHIVWGWPVQQLGFEGLEAYLPEFDGLAEPAGTIRSRCTGTFLRLRLLCHDPAGGPEARVELVVGSDVNRITCWLSYPSETPTPEFLNWVDRLAQCGFGRFGAIGESSGWTVDWRDEAGWSNLEKRVLNPDSDRGHVAGVAKKAPMVRVSPDEVELTDARGVSRVSVRNP